MTPTQKIQKLNDLSNLLRNTVSNMAELFKDNSTMEHLVWRINKQISLLQQEICKSLEKEITDEEFQRLIKQFDEDDK